MSFPSPLPALHRRLAVGIITVAVVGVVWSGMSAWRGDTNGPDLEAFLMGGGSPLAAQVIGGNMLRFTAQQMAQGQTFPAGQQILFTCGPSSGGNVLFGPLLAEDRQIWLWGFLYPGPQGTLGDQSTWQFFFSRRMYARHPTLAQRPLLREFPAAGGEFFLYSDRALQVKCGTPDASIELGSGQGAGSSASSSDTSTPFTACPAGQTCTVSRNGSQCAFTQPPNPPAGMTMIASGTCGGGTCQGTCYQFVPSGPSSSSMSSDASSSTGGQDLPDLVLTHALQGVAEWPGDMLVDLTVRNMGGSEAASYMMEMPMLTVPGAEGVAFSRQSTDPSCAVVANRIRCVSTAALGVGQSRTFRIGLRTADVTPCRPLNLVYNAIVNTPTDAFFTNNAISFMLQARCPAVSSVSSSAASSDTSSLAGDTTHSAASSAPANARQLLGCTSGQGKDPYTNQNRTLNLCVYREPAGMYATDPYAATMTVEADFPGDAQTTLSHLVPNSLNIGSPWQCNWDNDLRGVACQSLYTAINPGASKTQEQFTLLPSDTCAWQTVNGSVIMKYGQNTGNEGIDNRPELRVDFQTEVTCATASTERPDLSVSVEALPQAPESVPLMNNAVLYRVKVKNNGLGPVNQYTLNYRTLAAAFTDGQPPLFADGINLFNPMYGVGDCVNGSCPGGIIPAGGTQEFQIIVGSMRFYSFCRAFDSQMEFAIGDTDPTHLGNGTLHVTASAAHTCAVPSASAVPPVTFTLGTTSVGVPKDVTFRITNITNQPQYCAVGPITSVPAGVSVVKNLNTNVDPTFILRMDATSARQITGPLSLMLGVYQGEKCAYTLTKTDAAGTQVETLNNLDHQGRPQSTVTLTHQLQGTVTGP